jgi:formylglycine-generating enzyme required for sulfatase activity
VTDISNAAYTQADPLTNPVNDAKALASVLGTLDFSVYTGIDLARNPMENALFDFEKAIRDAEVALFYFAGHGLQVKGENYLLPVDAHIEMELHLKRRTFWLGEIVNVMSKKTRTNLILLDACRKNPFTYSLWRSLGLDGERSLQRGLAEVRAADGVFIAFATAPNAVALDGEGNNSPFAEALLKHIVKPGVSVTDMMTDVIYEVAHVTNDRQVPWQHSNLRAKVYFKSLEVPIHSDERLALAAEAWEDVKDTANLSKLERFARHFSGTYYAELAVEVIAHLREPRDPESSSHDIEVQSHIEMEQNSAAPRTQEVVREGMRHETTPPFIHSEHRHLLAASAWAHVKDTADLIKLRSFAKQFAGTYYSEEAEERLLELERAEPWDVSALVKATEEADALAKPEAELKLLEAKRAEIKTQIAETNDREALFALWQEDPQAVVARLKSLGLERVPSRKARKAVSYWLRPGESFRDGDSAPEMVIIPLGSFMMGSRDGEGQMTERPQHQVIIPQAFAVGKYPVTFAEWDAAFAEGGILYKPNDEGWGRGRRPVINVSWNDCKSYIRWLNSKTALPYRLLSEAEWEYCCRANTYSTYIFGSTINETMARFNGGKTVEVGSFDGNAFGLHDMHGNVWEWCEDSWHDSYVTKPEKLKGTGAAWVNEGIRLRVFRGGSWDNNDPKTLRSAARVGFYPEHRANIYGFRVARTLDT